MGKIFPISLRKECNSFYFHVYNFSLVLLPKKDFNSMSDILIKYDFFKLEEVKISAGKAMILNVMLYIKYALSTATGLFTVRYIYISLNSIVLIVKFLRYSFPFPITKTHKIMKNVTIGKQVLKRPGVKVG